MDHARYYEINLPLSTLLLEIQGLLFEHGGLEVRGSHRDDCMNVKHGLFFYLYELRKGTFLQLSDKQDINRDVQSFSK